MEELWRHALLVLSVGALAWTSLRLASALVEGGLERVMAAAAFGAAIAIVEALLLGVTGIGLSPIAIAGLALVTALAATLTRPMPVSPISEVRAWWIGAPASGKVFVGAGLGMALAWIVGNAYRPDIGIDGAYYHLPEIVAWVREGNPGSVQPIHPWLEVGSYPVAQEALLSWSMGLTRSLIPLSLVGVACLCLLAVSAWSGLRSLGVEPKLRAIAIVCVISTPVLVAQVDGPANDVPALTWLACTAALCAASRERPQLLAPALVSGGLAIGAKTTVLPLTVIVLALTLYVHRHALRPHRLPLALSALAAAVVGAFWYLRNLIDHGSPFYPFADTPWGTPSPELFSSFTSFFRDPAAALEGNVDNYLAALSGSWLVIAAALLVPLVVRRREIIVCSALVLGSIVLWSLAPTTGTSDFPQLSAAVSQTRYLLPVVGLSTLTLLLAARTGERVRLGVGWVLVVATAWSLIELLTGGFPGAGAVAWVALGGIAGAGIALVPAPDVSLSARGAALCAVALGLVSATSLTLGASGYTSRYGQISPYFDAALVKYFADSERADSADDIYMTPEVAGMLTGDGLHRTILLIGLRESCETVASLNEEAWVILRTDPLYESELGFTSGRCLAENPEAATVGPYSVYPPTRSE